MNELLIYIDYLGTLAFAISGVLIGTEKKFDLFGVLILGFVTAIGGSTLRDILIGVKPMGWMQNEVYFYLIFSAIPVVYFFKSTILKWRKGVFMFDTIGIGVFTIIGVQKTLSVGLSPLVAVLMGVVSAVFGGVLRDVLSNEIPLIFRKEIYAFACLVGAVTFLISDYFLWNELASVISITVVILVRISAILLKWELPFNVRSKN
tara:strand:+ start:6691 stop:7305 length:615 start_codon:yes stop_codon:yes gene_type:complete